MWVVETSSKLPKRQIGIAWISGTELEKPEFFLT